MVDMLILGGLARLVPLLLLPVLVRRHLLSGQAAAAGQGDAGPELQEAGRDPGLEEEAGGQDRAPPGGGRGTRKERSLIPWLGWRSTVNN